ncbi:MAG: hypothetical protein GY772_15995, partial [bacterium]|nr:hypothetical protein [bacterium]
MQIDVVCGDSNAAAFLHADNVEPDTKNGLISVLTRAAIVELNKKNPEWWQRVTVRCLDNNPFQYDPDDMDCMNMSLYSWAKTESATKEREENRLADQELREQPEANNPFSADQPFLAGPCDWDIRLAERFLYLTNTDLWLGDHDKSWHLPLLVTLREEAKKENNINGSPS